MTDNQSPGTEKQNYPPIEGNTQAYPAAGNDQMEGQFDIMRILQILLIHKWKFLAIVLFVLVIAFIYAVRQPKYFVSKYEVFYNESIKEFVVESNVPVIKSDFDKNFWLSTMNSEEVARLTLKNSGLPYNTAIIKRMFKVEMKDKKDNSNAPSYEVTITSKKSEIVPILIKSYIQALNDILLKNQVTNSEKLVSFLSNQLGDNNRKLSEIDLNIMMNSSANPGQLRDLKKVSSDLDAFRTDLLNTQINLSSTSASKQRTEHELKNLDGTIVNESAFSEPLKVQLMNLQVDLARALTKQTEDHPTVIAIRDNIAQINRMLHDSIQQKLEIKSLVQNPLKSQLLSKLMEMQIQEISLQTRALSLQRVIAEFESKMMPDTTDESQQQLLRSRELVFVTINLLNSKLIEVQSAAQGSLSRFVLIDEPVAPTSPANKGMMFIMLLGLVAGIFLAGGGIFLYDMIDNRLELVSDFEKFYSMPLLGTVLHKSSPQDYYVNPATRSSSYYNRNEMGEIVVNIKQVLKDPDKKLFSVCSPVRKEGKSMISVQLATALADKKLKVLLVDMDMFIPKLTNRLGRADNIGLINYLHGENTLDEILVPIETPGFSFVGVGNAADRSDFYYDDPNFIRFTQQVKEQFDIVIFDTPAVLHIPDIVTFMDQMDGVLIIARLAHTSRKSLDRLLKMIGIHRTKITGVIVNDLKLNVVNKYTDHYHYAYEYNYNEEGKKVKKRKKRNSEELQVA